MKNGEGGREPEEFCFFGHLLMHIVNVPQEAVFVLQGRQMPPFSLCALCQKAEVSRMKYLKQTLVLLCCLTFP